MIVIERAVWNATTKEQFYADYHYYIGYNILMYGKDASTIVTTCLHEGRHAHQHQVAKGFVEHDNPVEAEAWRENLKDGHYISFRENPRGYYEQPVEVDAREFAARRYEELVTERFQAEMDRSNDYCSAKSVFEAQIRSIENEGTALAANFQKNQNSSNMQEIVELEDTNRIHL